MKELLKSDSSCQSYAQMKKGPVFLTHSILEDRMSGVKSGALCYSTSVLLCTRGALESKSHEQFDRCLAATVWTARYHSHSPMHHSLSPMAAWKPLQCTRAWRHRLKPKIAGTCLSETSEVCPWAEMPSDGNMVINQQSFIDQSTDQWRDCFIACLKAKSQSRR